MNVPHWAWDVARVWLCAAAVLVTAWAVLGYRAKTRRNNTTTTPEEGNHS